MDEDEQHPGGLDPEDDPSSPAPDSGPLMIGPILGVIIGFVTFRVLPDSTPLPLALLIALAVIVVVIYVSIEIGRRRTRRR